MGPSNYNYPSTRRVSYTEQRTDRGVGLSRDHFHVKNLSDLIIRFFQNETK